MKSKGAVRITILNWDKYQRPLRGKGGASSRRSWIAVSTDLCRSNDYLMLDLLHRNVWVMLMCHAGVVGPVFDLCPTVARRMFDLPRTPDFSLLADQGLIEIGVVAKTKKRRLHNKTRQDKTEQDKGWGSCPKDINQTAWQEWTEYKGGKPAKQTITKTVHFLQKYTETEQCDIVNASIRNTWKGLFAPKGTDNGKSRSSGKPSFDEQFAALQQKHDNL